MKYNKWKFPTGEVGVALTHENLKEPLVLRWNKGTDIFEWFQVIDAYRHHNPFWDGEVTIPYLPYSRQDKVHNFGESAAFPLLLNFFKEVGVSQINTFDAHFTNKYAGNCTESFGSGADRFYINAKRLNYDEYKDIIQADFLCFPDSNARNHGFFVGEYDEDAGEWKNCLPSLTFDKIRGDQFIMLGYKSKNDIDLCLTGKNILISDDICDGGGTFTKAADKLKIINKASKIILFVTHGFFTKGLDCLYEAGIDKIITTNTVCDFEETDKLKIIKVI